MRAWDQYEILGALGKGKYGVVCRARHKQLGIFVALKSVINLQVFCDGVSNNSSDISLGTLPPSDLSKQRAALYHEAKILAKLNHPSLVSLVELCVDATGELVMAMEDLGRMSLTGLVERNGNNGLCQTLIGCVVGHIGNALQYMHSKGFLHRDIKANNIMVENNGSCFPNAKLIDFGLSLSFSEDNLPNSSLTRAGTLSNMAPELMSPDRVYGPKVDLFSLGTAIYFALTGNDPFIAFTTGGGQRTTTSVFGLQVQHEEALDELRPEVRSILKAMLEVDVNKRCIMTDLLECQWVVNSFRGSEFNVRFQSDFNILDSWLSLHHNDAVHNSKCLYCSFSSSQSSLEEESDSCSGESDTSASSSEISSVSSSRSCEEGLGSNNNNYSQFEFVKGYCKLLGFTNDSCKNEISCVCVRDLLLDESLISSVAKVLDQDKKSIHSSITERPWGKEGGVYNLLKIDSRDKFFSIADSCERKEECSNIDDWKTKTM